MTAPQQPENVRFIVDGSVLPDGEIQLTLQVGPCGFMVNTGSPDSAEQIGAAIRNQLYKAAHEARQRASGLVLPTMPGFPLGQFPGAGPLPGFPGPAGLPSGHPDRTE